MVVNEDSQCEECTGFMGSIIGGNCHHLVWLFIVLVVGGVLFTVLLLVVICKLRKRLKEEKEK